MGLIKQVLSIFGYEDEEELPEVTVAEPVEITEESLLQELKECESMFLRRKENMDYRVAQMWHNLYEERAQIVDDIYQTAVKAGYADEDGNWPTKEMRERHEPD